MARDNATVSRRQGVLPRRRPAVSRASAFQHHATGSLNRCGVDRSFTKIRTASDQYWHAADARSWIVLLQRRSVHWEPAYIDRRPAMRRLGIVLASIVSMLVIAGCGGDRPSSPLPVRDP